MEGFQKTHTFGRKFAKFSRSSQNIPGQMEFWNFPMTLLSDVSGYLWRWCIIRFLYFRKWKKEWFDNQWHANILTKKNTCAEWCSLPECQIKYTLFYILHIYTLSHAVMELHACCNTVWQENRLREQFQVL